MHEETQETEDLLGGPFQMLPIEKLGEAVAYCFSNGGGEVDIAKPVLILVQIILSC